MKNGFHFIILSFNPPFGWWEEKREERGGISLVGEKREERGVVSHPLIQTKLRNPILSLQFR